MQTVRRKRSAAHQRREINMEYSETYIIGGVREGDTSVRFELISPDGEVTKLRVTPKMWEKFELSSGDAVSADTVNRLETLSEMCEAVTRAAKYAEASPQSVRALIMKLKRAGFSSEAAENAADMLVKRGLIDEQGQADRFAEKSVRTGRGRSRIVRDLIAHGYLHDVSKNAADSISADEYAAALRKSLSKKCRNGIPTERKDRDKIVASLVRCGFSVSEIIREFDRLS